MEFKKFILLGAVFLAFWIPAAAQAASLKFSPPSGNFVVGETFNVAVYLDTEGKSVNALDLTLNFPPDKMQVVSPGTGNSIVGVWVSQPRFNNQEGTIRLQGGIPEGINVSAGLVTTITFRARGVGSAALKFGASSRVLANDGSGTDVLGQTKNGVYDLSLPPPAGPMVTSPTHPNQTKWYANSGIILNWANNNPVEGYSYVLNGTPVDNPDDIADGKVSSITYKNLADGTRFFHIKALRNGVWGGVTHFAIKIDTTPPADFPIEILPAARTIRVQPVIQFETTDNSSGLDRYEIKIVPLQPIAAAGLGDTFFVEARSPYITQTLSLGAYDVIVRVFDQAGNVREKTKRLNIVPVTFSFMGDRGLELKGRLVLPWGAVWIILAVILILLARLAMRTRAWHENVHAAQLAKELPQELKKKIKDLKDFRQKYGKILVMLSFLFVLPLNFVWAQEGGVSPPSITTFSGNIANDEIFYAGGRVNDPGSSVILYLQNAQTLDTQNFTVPADKKGEWFYRHSAFLTPGEYILWAQSQSGNTLSPPSPQIRLLVNQTALQFGATRISYEFLYLILMLASSLAALALLAYIIFHWLRGRKKHLAMLQEIQEAEETVRRGFALVKRDIETHLRTARQESSSEESKSKIEQIRKDLEWAEKHAGKELLDIENLEIN